MSKFVVAVVLCLLIAPTYAAIDQCPGARPVTPGVPHRNAGLIAPGIQLGNGSFTHTHTDLSTSGRVVGLNMTRVYRSDMSFDGPIGRGWTGGYFQAALVLEDGDIRWWDERGFVHTFALRGTYHISPPGVYVSAETVIGIEGSTVKLTEANGAVREFNQHGRLAELRDRNGNAVTLQYGGDCKLASVTDDRGYVWEFEYDADGRITKLIDRVWETGSRDAREVEYVYDAQGLLLKARMPETARYNDALNNRVEWHYSYDIAGRLTAVVAPNEAGVGGAPRIEIEYDDSDRVVRFRSGSLGDHYIRYPSEEVVRHVDPRGVRADYSLDRKGHTTAREQFTGFWDVDTEPPLDHSVVVQTAAKLRSGDPDSFVTSHTFNRGHERTSTTHPNGRQELFKYPTPTKLARDFADDIAANVITATGAGWDADEFAGGIVRLGASRAEFEYYEVESNSDEALVVKSVDIEQLGWTAGDRFVVFTENPDRMAGGNLLEHRLVSDVPGVNDIVKTSTYETVFQLVRSTTSARGHVTEREYVYDLSGDPTTSDAGNLILERSPPVDVLQPDGTTVTAIYETTYDYNNYGQLTATTDPEDSTELRQYYTSGDQLGFLEQIVAAWGTLDLTERFEYDKTGLLTGQWPPIAFSAGVNAEDYKVVFEVNELSQTWHESGAVLDVTVDERVETYHYFDASGSETQTWREYVTSDGTAPAPPTDPNDPATFSKASIEMEATWVETLRTFDLGGRLLTETTDAVAATPVETDTWTHEYDSLGNRTARISPLGTRTETIFDERHLLWRQVEAAGTSAEGTHEHDYTFNGLIKFKRTPLGRETEHQYDAFDREISVVDPADHSQQFEYDSDGNVTVERTVSDLGEALAETTHEYDQIDRRFRTNHLAENSVGIAIGTGFGETWWTLNARGQTVAETRSPGGSWTSIYDNAGRRTNETDPLGNATDLTLDESGNVTQAVLTDFNQLTGLFQTSPWEADYDRRDNIVRVRDTRHQAVSFDTEVEHFFDGWSRIVSSVDPTGAARTFTYDLKSRRTGDFESPDGILLCTGATSGWDKDDRLISKGRWSLPGGAEVQLTGFGYDERDRLTTVTRPDGLGTSLSYDIDSNLTGWIGHNGAGFSQTTEPRGLVDVRTITRGTGESGATEERFEWDGAKRLVSAITMEGVIPTSALTFGYNTLGRADASSTTIFAPSGTLVGTWIAAATYDEHARLTGTMYPNGTELINEIDDLGRMVSLTENASGLELATMLWSGAAQLVNSTFFNGTATTATYESGRSDRVARLSHERGANAMFGFDRRYDANGQLTRERRDHDGETGRVLTHDFERRLTGVQFGAELFGAALDAANDPTDFGLVETYALDTVGNRSGTFGLALTTDTGVVVESQDYTVSTDGLNRYVSVNGLEFTYGSAARVDFDEATGVYYQYDYLGHLTAMDDAPDFLSPERIFRYDALGRRVLEEVYSAGVLQERIVSQYAPGKAGMVIADLAFDAMGDPVGESLYAIGPSFFKDTAPLAERRNGEWCVRHVDPDGSLTALTNENGKRIVEFDYQPFGAPVRRGVMLDLEAPEILLVEQDTPVVGTTRVHVVPALEPDALAGRELAISLPAAGSGRYRTAEVLTNTATTIDVHDPVGEVLDALENLGSGFVVFASHVHFDGDAPTWSYDSILDVSTFFVGGADFSPWLLGGWLAPDTSRPAYLEITEVDPAGDWIRVRGDATSTSGVSDHWRALPPVGVSENGGWSEVESRFLYRAFRHDVALRFTAWPTSPWLSRRGLYSFGSRPFDSRLGRWLTQIPAGVRQPYSYRPWGDLRDLNVPTGVPGLRDTLR